MPDDEIETENLKKLEAGIGRLYILGTALYTTGEPFRFRVMKDIETKNHYALEQSLHKFLDPYRINNLREFFAEKCLPFVDKVVAIHNQIHSVL